MSAISAIVITLNEESNIGECLEALKWCEEIIVVDSNSSDKTVEIAKKFTEKIIKTDETRFGRKRNIGIEAASNDWILWVDADERVSPELREEIERILEKTENNPLGPPLLRGNEGLTGYLIKRQTFFLGKFIRHCGWYPDYSLRLFRRTRNVRFSDVRVHEKTLHEGKTLKLNNPIRHYTDLTLEHYLNKQNKYTTLAAMDLKEDNRITSRTGVIFRPILTFLKMYFIKLGFLDGFIGFILCVLSGYSTYAKYSKLYFLTNGRQ
jgi:glycosyltransferase involved in cell wall biosynthesis